MTCGQCVREWAGGAWCRCVSGVEGIVGGLKEVWQIGNTGPGAKTSGIITSQQRNWIQTVGRFHNKDQQLLPVLLNKQNK